MARNYHIVSATFDGITMTDPQSYRIHQTGTPKTLDAGIDNYQSSLKLAGRHVLVQVSFNDQAALQSMNGKFGGSGTLVVVTRLVDDATTKTATMTATCVDVQGDAQHSEFGAHVASFHAVASDGSTDPITWS